MFERRNRLNVIKIFSTLQFCFLEPLDVVAIVLKVGFNLKKLICEKKTFFTWS